MNFIAVKCPSCGANVNVDPATKFGVCTFCGATVTQNKIVVEHVNANTTATPEATLLRAQTLLAEKRYDEALKKFEEVLNIDPRCSRAYQGALCASEKCPNLQTLAGITTKHLAQYVMYGYAKEYATEQEMEELERCEKFANERLETAINKMDFAFKQAIADSEETYQRVYDEYTKEKQEHDLSVAKRHKSIKIWKSVTIITGILTLCVAAGLLFVFSTHDRRPMPTNWLIMGSGIVLAVLSTIFHQKVGDRYWELDCVEIWDEHQKNRIDSGKKHLDEMKEKYTSWLSRKYQTDYRESATKDDPIYKVIWDIINGKYEKSQIERWFTFY